MLELLVVLVFQAGFLYLLDRRDQRHSSAEQAHREQIAALSESHRQEIAQLNQARLAEVADLLQRIQAPEVATADHASRDAEPDPPPVDLEDDADMLAAYEQRMQSFALELEAMQ